MQGKLKIVVLEGDSIGKDVSWEALSEYGELVVYPTTAFDEIMERIQDADIIIPNKSLLNESNLSKAKQLKLICEAATGYNNIDIDYCKKQGILVTNVRAYSTSSVCQHTFAMLFQILESLDSYSEYINTGKYSQGESFTWMGEVFHELEGMTMGIVGMGNIGNRVAQIATAFGMKVLCYSASGNKYDIPYMQVDFDTLLETSDVISVHAPLNEYTKDLFDREAFTKMKESAIFLNTGRGPIVVEEDLAWALENRQIKAAGLDVFTLEPLHSENPLLRIKDKNRLFMTPHIAWASYEARVRLVADIAASVQAFLEGNPRNLL